MTNPIIDWDFVLEYFGHTKLWYRAEAINVENIPINWTNLESFVGKWIIFYGKRS